MIRYIETSNRVFAWEVTPDTEPELVRPRTITITIVSGPPLSLEEYQRLSARLVAELVGEGVIVHSWEDVPSDS